MEEKELKDLELDDIVKEFTGKQEPVAQDAVTPEELKAMEEQIEEALTGDTIRLDTIVIPKAAAATQDTVRLDRVGAQQATADTVRIDADTVKISADTVKMAALSADEPAEAQQMPEAAPEAEKVEPYSAGWEPEYEQPIGEYVPPKPIEFKPYSKARELKRKLVAGPERRYYELNEQGLGKLQLAILLSLIVVLLSAGTTALYALGRISTARLKLMVFVQFMAMLLSALLGSFQMIEGLMDLRQKRFTLNTMLVFTFVACCLDGLVCLRQQRIPCCAAFSLQVTMSLWSAYQRRATEMGQMDTLRKANKLDAIVEVPDYYDGCSGMLRTEGRLEDFMDRYEAVSTPERILSVYTLAALGASVLIGAVAGVLHRSISFGIQALSVSLLAAVPVTSFVVLTRPMAILERKLHKQGVVLCGWEGIRTMSRRVVFPLEHSDLFPTGSCKLNGVKFYGSRDPDQVVAYCNAVISADGGGLAPLFEQLLNSRSGRHYPVEHLRRYAGGGVGGEVCDEPVLIGVLPFLKKMGVEIPEGTSVNQAVYAAIDGELCGVFAVTYAKIKSSGDGLNALCGYRGLRGVLISSDFMLTEDFVRSKFRVNTRRLCFPDQSIRGEISRKQPAEDAKNLALITAKGLAPYTYAVAGARNVRSASLVGMVIQMAGGIIGLAIMAILAVLGAKELLTPANMFLYELVWLIPGLLITEWTRSI